MIKFWYFFGTFSGPDLPNTTNIRFVKVKLAFWYAVVTCHKMVKVPGAIICTRDENESRIYPIMNRKSLLSNLSVEIPLKIWALQLDFYNWICLTFNWWVIIVESLRWVTVLGTLVIVEKREKHWQFQNYLIWLMLKVQRTEWCSCHLNLTN